jgi:UDP-N-acetylglucosamine--N-acetylmuramyl-(pentapeptide) pyrophosphoryl-undecaprenol N-acetylglucosamine transferase
MTTIFVAASGSGGHLFPAVYVAEELRKLDANTKIIGIGSGRPLEEKIFSDWKVPFEVVPTVGIKGRGLKGLFQFLLSIPKAFYCTLSLFKKYKPSAVVGMGGYATVFPILVAWIFGIPTWIHEAELKPGLANWFLSFFVNKVSVAFPNAKIICLADKVVTGHPVRPNLEIARKKSAPNQIKNILVLGGSQGAKGLDESLPKISKIFNKYNCSVKHQARKEKVQQVLDNYKQNGLSKIEVISFIDDMISAYQWADLVIARSGAGSVMEISVVNIPTIFVPFPYAQGDHQTANALTIVANEKALLVSELDPNFERKLQESIEILLEPNNYNRMLLKDAENRTLNASKSIAEGIFSLIV